MVEKGVIHFKYIHLHYFCFGILKCRSYKMFNVEMVKIYTHANDRQFFFINRFGIFK